MSSGRYDGRRPPQVTKDCVGLSNVRNTPPTFMERLKRWGGVVFLLAAAAIVTVELTTSVRLSAHLNADLFGRVLDALLSFLAL